MSTSIQLTRPGSVTRAYRLSMLIIVLGILSNGAAFLPGNDTSDTVDQLKTSTAAAGVDPGHVLYAAAIFALLTLFIEMFMVMKMRDGSNKARIVLTILTVAQIIGFATSLPRLLDRVDTVFGAAQLGAMTLTTLLGIALLFSMYARESNSYFKKS
jgi:hypothetical protein